MTHRPLEGRVALITGASAGIGAATAREFARQGAKLILNARRAERLSELERELDGPPPIGQGTETAHTVAGDCAEPDVIDRMLQSAADHFHRHSCLVVVNAGRGLAGSLLTSDMRHWEEMVQTNYIGAARLMRAAATQMIAAIGRAAKAAGVEPTGPAGPWLERPHDIVVIGSTVGRNVSPFSSMYGSTKFALHSLVEALRREAGPKGVRVTLVAPGVVVSEFQRVAGYTGDLVDGFQEKFGPLLSPEDVARTIAFVCSQPPHVHVGDIVLRATRQDYP